MGAGDVPMPPGRRSPMPPGRRSTDASRAAGAPMLLGLHAMDLRLDGRTALVTGASRGIGQAIALALSSAGASVMISSRKADALAGAAAEIAGANGDRSGEVGWHVAN